MILWHLEQQYVTIIKVERFIFNYYFYKNKIKNKNLNQIIIKIFTTSTTTTIDVDKLKNNRPLYVSLFVFKGKDGPILDAMENQIYFFFSLQSKWPSLCF